MCGLVLALQRCSTTPAEEYTYRFLAAARAWADDEPAATDRIGATPATGNDMRGAPAAPGPTTAEVRAWARSNDLTVSDRGKLRLEIWDAWRTPTAHSTDGDQPLTHRSAPDTAGNAGRTTLDTQRVST